MFAGIGANAGMQTFAGAAPVAEFAAAWATRDLGLALAAGVVAAIGIAMATRRDRSARRLKALPPHPAAALPALSARR